jgi:hypothetical protein
MLREFFAFEADLHDPDRRPQALIRIRGQLSRWASAANAEADSPARSQARRVLRAITSGTGQVQDAEYRKLLEQYSLRGR